MAIAWWMDTGIHFKMATDIKAEYGSQLNYWQRPKIRDNLPLGFSHVAPSVIIYGFATLLSLIAFALEIFHYRQNKIKNRRSQRQRQLNRARALPRSTMKQRKILKKAWA